MTEKNELPDESEHGEAISGEYLPHVSSRADRDAGQRDTAREPVTLDQDFIKKVSEQTDQSDTDTDTEKGSEQSSEQQSLKRKPYTAAQVKHAQNSLFGLFSMGLHVLHAVNHQNTYGMDERTAEQLAEGCAPLMAKYGLAEMLTDSEQYAEEIKAAKAVGMVLIGIYAAVKQANQPAAKHSAAPVQYDQAQGVAYGN